MSEFGIKVFDNNGNIILSNDSIILTVLGQFTTPQFATGSRSGTVVEPHLSEGDLMWWPLTTPVVSYTFYGITVKKTGGTTFEWVVSLDSRVKNPYSHSYENVPSLTVGYGIK